MRCPKCQYVGFEPSPRCKNCGYEISLSGDEFDPPSLTLVTEPDAAGPLGDFDLNIFDDVPARKGQSSAKPFDLDDLLATGRSGSADPETAPVIEAVSAVARRRQSSSRSVSASAVATPPPLEVEALFRPAPAKPAHVTPEPELEHELDSAFASRESIDLDLVIESAPVVTSQPEPELTAEPDAPAPVPVMATPPPAPAPVTTELPLFMKGMSETSESGVPAAKPVVHAPVPASVEAAAQLGEAPITAEIAMDVDDRPLVEVPSVPRAPLAVRRTTPDPARLRAKYGRAAARSRIDTTPVETSGDLLSGADQLDARLELRAVPPAERLSVEPTPTSLPAGWLPGVGAGKRLMAAALDSALLLALDGIVIYFTLRVCGLAPAQAGLLPVVPLLLFFLLIDAGYLVLFTAACGQTIGKMAAGIRVVGTSTSAVVNDRITISQAVMRSLASVVSMLPLGAGFWFGLVGDRRAVHDRLAHTRVVSA